MISAVLPKPLLLGLCCWLLIISSHGDLLSPFLSACKELLTDLVLSMSLCVPLICLSAERQPRRVTLSLLHPSQPL